MILTNKLKGKIVENGYTQKELSELIGIDVSTFSMKINNKYEFSTSEIKKMAELLNLDNSDIMAIFMN